MILGPRVDKDFVPDNPYRLVKEGHHQHVDVISGVTSHEGSLFSFGNRKFSFGFDDDGTSYDLWFKGKRRILCDVRISWTDKDDSV